MPSWDIDPAGVQGVLQRTQEVALGFEREFTAYQTAMQGAAENSASEIVALALVGFAEAKMPKLQFLVDRTGAALTGAASATNAYIQGDLEMAATAQASATAAPDGSFGSAGAGPVPQ